ncbi:hypothetical protein NKJ11_24395 [Mesorhizobium sp. M0243]
MDAFNLIGREPTNPAIGIPHIIARPIGAGVAGRLRVDAVGNALYERAFASISNDCLKEGGRFLFIVSTLLKIPVAALGLKKYFSGTSLVSMHGNNVDATALLGDSEILAVKHTPRHTVPEFVQRLEYDCEVASSVTREKPVHVFEDNGSWSTSSNEPHEVVKESRLDPSKPRSWPHSRKREVLAGKSCCPDISVRDFCVIELPDVIVNGYVGPVLLQDVPTKRLYLAMELQTEASALQSQVEPSDPGEE